MIDSPGQSRSYLRSPHGPASVHLNAIRGLAAVGVCLSHVHDLFYESYKAQHPKPLITAVYAVTGIGHQWVIVFFVLSGYLVGGSVLRSLAQDRWSWPAYMFNRLTRLYVVLVPALALGALLDLSGIHLFGTGGVYGGHAGTADVTAPVASRLSIPILLGNYAFLQGIYLPTFGSNGALWSLAYEFWYYVAFPFLACALWPRLTNRQRVMNGAFLVAAVILMGRYAALAGLAWLMGVVIHYLPPLPVKRPLVRWAVISGAIVESAVAAEWFRHSRSIGADSLLGCAVAGVIYVFVNSSGGLPKAYIWMADRLSRFSYTLYLVHLPLLVFLAGWLGVRQWLPGWPALLKTCAMLAAALIYAQIVWFLFERRTDEIRVRLRALFLRLPATEAKTLTRG
jgi:peptidoglycan/LPS O-acetylase OafA/YrhL